MSNTILQFDHVIKHYDNICVLKGVSGHIAQGEVIALLGKNGAGKTTLMETLLGFVPSDAGTLSLFGQTPVLLKELAKKRIGYVPQEDDMLQHLTVSSWLQLIESFYDNWDRALQDKLISDWDIPRDKRISKLSVGQRQKVSILTGICHRPDLIVLDEPVASLDPIARRQFLEMLIGLTQEHAPAILFSTHIVSDVERVATRVWLMREGHIVLDRELDALKESVVRVHGTATQIDALKPMATIEHLRNQNDFCSAVISNWSNDWPLAVSMRIEHLNLEDIFVELHA